MLGFNDTSTLVGHIVSSPREKEKRDRGYSRDEREKQGRKRKINDSEETEEIKTFPLLPLPAARTEGLVQRKLISVGHPGDVRCTTPLPHPTTPIFSTVNTLNTQTQDLYYSSLTAFVTYVNFFVNTLNIQTLHW